MHWNIYTIDNRFSYIIRALHGCNYQGVFTVVSCAFEKVCFVNFSSTHVHFSTHQSVHGFITRKTTAFKLNILHFPCTVSLLVTNKYTIFFKECHLRCVANYIGGRVVKNTPFKQT